MTQEREDDDAGTHRFAFPKIARTAAGNDLTLSVAQKLWIESGVVPHQEQWLPFVWRLEGRLDVSTFVKSYGQMVHRHGILRTRVLQRDGTWVQHVDPAGAVRLTLTDLEAVAADKREYELHTRLKAVIDGKPPLEEGLVQLQLFRLRPDLHVLGGFIHNAAMDAHSHQMFLHELMEGYIREVEKKPGLPSGALQYSDFVIWEKEWLTDDQLATADRFWAERLGNAEPLRLPKGRTFGDPATSWATERLLMPADIHAAAMGLATATRVSLSAIFYSALAVALARWSGQTGILFGSLLSGRPAGFRGVMGSFTQVKPFFVSLRDDPTIGQLIVDAGRALLAAHDTRMPVAPGLLRELSAGNVIVNYSRSGEMMRSAREGDASPKPQVFAGPRAPAPGSLREKKGSFLTSPSAPRAQPANAERAAGRPVAGEAQRSRPTSLRASGMALPLPLQPEFSRDFYFNMMQTPDGLHGLVTYSNTRHEQSATRQLADDIFTIMAAMTANASQKLSSLGRGRWN